MRLLISILALVGISALGGSIVLLQSEPIYIAPSLQRLDPEATRWILVVLAFFYSAFALVAAYASWRRASWAHGAYAAFAMAAVLFMAFFLYIAPIPLDTFSLIVGPVFFALLGWGLWKGRSVLAAELRRQRVRSAT